MASHFRNLFDKSFNKSKETDKVPKSATSSVYRATVPAEEIDAQLPNTATDPPSSIVSGRDPEQRSASNVPAPIPIVDDNNGDDNDINGMFTFIGKPPEALGIVDIVAVHGLNGHFRKTWTTSGTTGDQVNWLESLLPQHIPYARVMSFGYDSSVPSNNNGSNIENFAEDLLADLVTHRSSELEKQRPIVFICHNLGGIIFKQALVRARERNHLTHLLDKIGGVAFFGTPHTTSSSAKLSEIIGTILKVSTLGYSTNSKLLADLKNHSESFRAITKPFVDRNKALRILNFYETDMMDYLNFRVVDDKAAVMNLPNEIGIPLEGNHITMCKFSDSRGGQRKFNRVGFHLKEITDELVAKAASYRTILSPHEQLQCLRGFYHKNYESFRDVNPDRVTGTCEWLFRHRDYQRWRNKESSDLLWVSADPGCGKSVLAKFLVEHLRWPERDQELLELVCHFFFKSESDDQHDSVLALRALLHQIFSSDKSLLRHAFPAFESKGTEMFNDFESMWDILSSVARDPKAMDLLIILDALDECKNISQARFLKYLNKLFSLKATNKKPFLKVIIFSRPDNGIKRSLSGNRAAVRLRGEDETEAISKDVALVVRHHISELGTQGLAKDFLSRLETALVEKADRSFLWTTPIIKLLQEATMSGASQTELEALLAAHNIDAVFSKLIKNCQFESIKKVLQLILAAARPLTLEELNVALIVSPERRDLEQLQSLLKHPMENYIKATCGNFLRVIQSRVYLVHQTAREFLLRRDQAEEGTPVGPWQEKVTLKDCRIAMLRSCISCLFLVSIDSANDIDTLDFFSYASEFWPKHYYSADDAIFFKLVNIAVDEIVDTPDHAHRWLLAHDLLLSFDNWRFFPTEVSDKRRKAIIEDLAHFVKGLVLWFERSGDCDIHAIDPTGKTLLHYAIASGSFMLVERLLQGGVSASTSDNRANTPLHLLAGGYKGIRAEGEPRAKSFYHRTAALSSFNFDSEKSNCSQSSSLDTEEIEIVPYFKDDEDDCLIHKPWCFEDIGDKLLAGGADIHAMTDEGQTPLSLALKFGSSETINWMQEKSVLPIL
ncbi:hypothetical protein EDB81DRAFT_728975 [Dactylonectria macrodidyma]|uniref:NACHT domain-containing protein n=1 Tax=Dactylonectria macrodidyma TaxID=307937 RepID=A0A9P9E0E3_9HYPO|nr:hypothetical protein EDB81DRAFT_728975 [Dactylonectria macrodidyma]